MNETIKRLSLTEEIIDDLWYWVINSQKQSHLDPTFLKSIDINKSLNSFFNDWNMIIENYADSMNDIYFFLVRLIYNSFIMNHILLDGNKRMYHSFTTFINSKINLKDLV